MSAQISSADARPNGFGRRGFLVGVSAAGLLALPGCASYGGFGYLDAVRRLLDYSTRNAFARLIQPGGFWDDQLARLDLPSVLGSRGGVLANILSSNLFRDRLQHQFNVFAEQGARRAAPIVADTVRTIGIQNAVDLIRGGPSGATSFLRDAMAGSLIDAMVPALGDAMRVAGDPLVSQAIGALAGVDIGNVARSFSAQVDDAIWGQVGREEAAIRADPRRTNDPVLIAALKLL